MHPKEFEEFVKDRLLEELSRSDIDIQHRKRIRGRRSGYEHEIDLSFEVDLAGTSLLVIIECKAYQRPVSVDDVLEFCSRIDDISAHKGILVSTSGFTDAAKTIAESKGVALVQAYVGLWRIIGRYTGPPPPRYSKTLFYFQRSGLVTKDNKLLVYLPPVNEVDMAGVFQFNEEAVNAMAEDRKRWGRQNSLKAVYEIIFSADFLVPKSG